MSDDDQVIEMLSRPGNRADGVRTPPAIRAESGGLDVERLARAYHAAHQSHDYETCPFQDLARDYAQDIAAEYARLAEDAGVRERSGE